jgi:hypothetical protein
MSGMTRKDGNVAIYQVTGMTGRRQQATLHLVMEEAGPVGLSMLNPGLLESDLPSRRRSPPPCDSRRLCSAAAPRRSISWSISARLSSLGNLTRLQGLVPDGATAPTLAPSEEPLTPRWLGGGCQVRWASLTPRRFVRFTRRRL